ncbi:glycosyltransferase family 2 protein [Priestia megaterium]|uniref:glycosyltransferase family 2 protein n=1 Tax=Priestia megaterium TaxID=1404 RepID=UPI0039AEE549
MNNILFSIIVPIYNVESYLQKTIESTLLQNIIHSEYEIILVNDGSTDGSLNICEKYEREYSNIILINKENQGVSTARNVGIERAKGQYLMFLDGDDLLEENILLKLKEAIERKKCDMLLCNYRRIINNDLTNVAELGYQYPERLIKNFDINDFLCWAYDNKMNYSWYVWRNIYSRSFILDNNLFFESQIGRGEDFDWLFSCWMIKANIEVANISITLYRERIVATEMNNHTSLKQYMDSFFIVNKWFSIIDSNKFENLSPKTIWVLKQLLANYFISVSAHIYSMKRPDRKDALKYFNKLKFVCKYTNRKYYRVLNNILAFDNIYLILLNFIYVNSRTIIIKKKLKDAKVNNKTLSKPI